MAQFISNPFQVLGVSDLQAGMEPPATLASVAPTPVAPAPKSHFLAFLEALGGVLYKDALPLALQIVLPILEKRV